MSISLTLLWWLVNHTIQPQARVYIATYYKYNQCSNPGVKVCEGKYKCCRKDDLHSWCALGIDNHCCFVESQPDNIYDMHCLERGSGTCHFTCCDNTKQEQICGDNCCNQGEKCVNNAYCVVPTLSPTPSPTANPSFNPSKHPTLFPTVAPTIITPNPTLTPTLMPTVMTSKPTLTPTINPTLYPTSIPTFIPTAIPTVNPTVIPTTNPTMGPTANPTIMTTMNPSFSPTLTPTLIPTPNPSAASTYNTKNVKQFSAVMIFAIIFGCSFGILIYCLFAKCKRKMPQIASIDLDLLNPEDQCNIEVVKDHVRSYAYSSEQQNEEYIDKINIQLELNDFHTLLADVSRQHKAIEICNAGSECAIVSRHYRDRFNPLKNEISLYSTKNPKMCAKKQILDKIHCFCQHSVMQNEQNYTDSKSNIMKHIKDRMNRKFHQLSFEQFDPGSEYFYDLNIDHKQNENCSFIRPKYGDLKEELTQNTLVRITPEMFSAELWKAQVHYQSYYYKKSLLTIAKWNDMTASNMLVLMVYCNYDKLQFEFSKTYRGSDKMKHSEFYHFGKLLKETVLEYGSSVSDRVIKNFYHGVTQKLIPPIIVGDLGKGISIFCPLSTSSDPAVATHFACEGLIMTFGGNSHAKYFSVDWLSDFPREKEHLFLQNREQIQIKNITDYSTNTEFGHWLNGLKALDFFLLDAYHDEHQNININQKQKSIETIVAILNHQCSISKMKKLHPYTQKLFDVYFHNKTKLSINYSVLQKKYKPLFKLLCLSEYQWIKLDVLQRIFPKIKILEIKPIKLCDDILKDIAKHATMFRFGKSLWKLDKMTVEVADESRLNAFDAKKKLHFECNELVIDDTNNTMVIR